MLGTRSRTGAPLRTVICRRCGLAWSDPRPHDARSFYETAYRVEYKGTYEPSPQHVLRAGKTALDRLSRMPPLGDAPRRMLDAGSGGGEFAYLLARLGHHVRGIEPNRGYAEYSIRQYRLAIDVGFVQDVALEPASFDVVTAWHVLEHTESPSSVLEALARALAPGAVMVVEVPNVEATCQSPANTFHEAHLYSFNVASLTGVAGKAGLEHVGHTLSPDGGNITMRLRRRESQPAGGPPPIPGNCERILAIVKGHTNLRHFATAHPYRRVFDRLRRSLAERSNVTRLTRGGRRLLDAFYDEAFGNRAGAP